jgi:adenylyltransferase/sulfurtransferase
MMNAPQPVDRDINLDRYVRQMRYAPLGEEGQRRLANRRALICGCGALGSVLANTLARAGVGYLRIVDRDFLQLNNLQRQVLYDESDVESGLPKAIAAANRLRTINSQIEIEPVVVDLDHTNVISMTHDMDVIVDGTDNFQTRFLLNDAAVYLGRPWVYGGCIGAEGQTMTIIPGRTPCLRCLLPTAPPPGSTPTCDTAGILGPIVNIIASWQAVEAIKILSGNEPAVSRTLNVFELWENRVRQVNLDSLLEHHDCSTCQGREFPWLRGERGDHTAVLCGRNAVQLSFPDRQHTLSLESLARRLKGVGQVMVNPFLLRLTVDQYVLTVFADGRAIINGTEDLTEARSVYARYVGA